MIFSPPVVSMPRGYYSSHLLLYTQLFSFPWVYSPIFSSYTQPIPFPWVYSPIFSSYTQPFPFPWVYSLIFSSYTQPVFFSLGIIHPFWLSTPRLINFPGAYLDLRPRTQKPASDDSIVMRQVSFCIYFLYLNSLYLSNRHFFATFTSRYPLGKLRSSCSVMPRIRISMTK